MAIRARIISFTIIPTMIKAAAGGYNLYWDVQSTDFTPTFKVQTAPTEAGPWTDLIDDPISEYELLESGPKRMSFQEDLVFRLLVINEVDNNELHDVTVLTGEATQAAFAKNRHDWLHYRDMVRREALGLSARYNGQPGFLLRRIIYGTRCTNCTDETLGGSASSECTTCFGTGFEEGYYPPVDLMIDMSDAPAEPNNTTQEKTGPSELRICDAVFPGYPSVKFKDIFVDATTRQRHEVAAIPAADELRGWSIRQIVTLSRLPPSDPAYQVPLS